MHPVLFTVPGLDWEVQAYGFFLGLALILGWIISLRLAEADRLPAQLLGTSYVLGAAAGLFAARGGWLFQHTDRFESWRSLLQLQPGGMAPFAGILLGLVVTAMHAQRRTKTPPTPWFDCLVPAYALGVVFERIGAFLAGSSFGTYAGPDFALAVTYPPDSPAFAWHRSHLQALLPAESVASLPVHPAPLYGMLLAGVGLGLCVWLRRNRTFSGQVFLGFTIYWLLARTMVEEWFRADHEAGVFGPLAAGQLTALVLVVALIPVYRARMRAARTDPSSVALWKGGPWTPAEDDGGGKKKKQ